MRKILIIIFAIVLNSAFVFAAEPSKNFLATGQVQLQDSAGGLLQAQNGYVLIRGSFGEPPAPVNTDLLDFSEASASATNLNVIDLTYVFIRGNPSRGGYLASATVEATASGILASNTAYVFVQPGIEVIGDIYSKNTISGGIVMSEKNAVAVSGDKVFVGANRVEDYKLASGSMMEWKSDLALKNQIMEENFKKLKKRAKTLTQSSYEGGNFFLNSRFDEPESNPTGANWNPTDYPEGGVWYRNGDLKIGNGNIDETRFYGKGTILVDGDLEIWSDAVSIPLQEQAGSLGFIVKGDIHIKDPSNAVRDNNKNPANPKQFQVVHGSYFSGKTIYADKVAADKASISLYIFGSLVADNFDFSARR